MAGKYDEMSFKKAFAAARKEKGSGKKFTWKGKSYSTNTKEDNAKKTTAKKKPVRPKARPESGSAVKTSPRPKARAGSLSAVKTSLRPKARDKEAPTATEVKTPQVTTTTLGKAGKKTSRLDEKGKTPARKGKVTTRLNKKGETPPMITYAQYKKMTRPQRRASGFPDYVLSEAMFKRNVLGKRNNFFKKVMGKK